MLLPGRIFRTLKAMEVHFNPDLQAKLDKLATETGRPTRELVEDVVAGYFDELAQTWDMLNGRYDDLKSGRVKPIDGEQFFESLRRLEDELLKKRLP
jgi:predicted transcriptional regulator